MIDLLNQYVAQFPDGKLMPEQLYLRIEAHFAKGDLGAVTTLGNRFLSSMPASPHARRVRTLLSNVAAKDAH